MQTKLAFVGLSGKRNLDAADPSLRAVAEFVERLDGDEFDQLLIEFEAPGAAVPTACLFHGRDGFAALLVDDGERWAHLADGPRADDPIPYGPVSFVQPPTGTIRTSRVLSALPVAITQDRRTPTRISECCRNM